MKCRRFNRTARLTALIALTAFVCFLLYQSGNDLSETFTGLIQIDLSTGASTPLQAARSQAPPSFLINKNPLVNRKALETKGLHYPYQILRDYVRPVKYNFNDRPPKRILMWNEAYGSKDFNIGLGTDSFSKSGCPIHNCITTDNRSLIPIEEFDAIIFHLRSFSLSDLPAKRSPHQRYIMWIMEAPAYQFVDVRPLANIFNWTMSFKMDSDIFHPYGFIEPVTPGLPFRPEGDQLDALIANSSGSINYASGKKKLVAWFVSNCRSTSRREAYVRELRKHIQVDVYGYCGTLLCPHSKEKECRLKLDRDYKFYLSFENSICDDYITEKFWSIMQLNIIPIVLADENHYASLAPPKSYIAAAKFNSPKSLANYLKILDQNDDLYNQYFWWKPHYQIFEDSRHLSRCELCAKLHTDRQPSAYSDMQNWWLEDSHCRAVQVKS